MSREKVELIEIARRKYKKILPCGSKKSFADCFTRFENKLFFWFDTEDRSTHFIFSEANIDKC